MAESPEPIESLVKKEAEPQRDPIVSRSTSAIILVDAMTWPAGTNLCLVLRSGLALTTDPLVTHAIASE